MQYPYLPEGRTILYVPANNEFMQAAKRVRDESGCVKQRTGAVIVLDGKIVGEGNNTTLHKPEICPRDEQGFETGQGYNLCKEVCQQQAGHAECNAVKDARTYGQDTDGADLYLYGHWWCCENCWNTMIDAGIKNVYLLEGVDASTDWASI